MSLNALRRFVGAGALALLCAVAGCAPDEGYVEVQTGPPPTEVEVVPAAPWPGAVWTAGYWRWDGVRYVWMPGHYERARPGLVWVPHHWERHGLRWRYLPGHWRRF